MEQNRFFIYARKSTDEIDKQVRSIGDQLAELRLLAKRDNLVVVDELIESKTAKFPGRPIFNQMTKRIQAGQADGIISWHPDRLARNSVDGGWIIYLLDIQKLKALRFPTFWFEPTPQGKFMLNMAFGQSKYYIDSMAENIRRAMINKARKGIWPGCPTVGYKNHPERRDIYVDHAKAPLVREAFHLYAAGKLGTDQIALRLREKGLTSRRGNLISKAAVYNLLRNPFYYGLVDWGGEVYEGEHEPLISKALFDKVQQVMEGREKLKNDKPRPVHQALFRGLFTCGECGLALNFSIAKGKYKFYRCAGFRKGFASQHIPEHELMGLVQDELSRISLSERQAKALTQAIAARRRQDKSRASLSHEEMYLRVAKLDVRLNKAAEAYLSGLMDEETYRKQKTALVMGKMALKERLSEVKQQGVEPTEQLLALVRWGRQLDQDLECGKWRSVHQALEAGFGERKVIQKKLFMAFKAPYGALTYRKDPEAFVRQGLKDLNNSPIS